MTEKSNDKEIVAPANEPKAEPSKPYDPFDPESLRVTEKDRAELGVDIVLVELACKRPGKQDWVRTHPDMKLETSLLKLEDANEFYLIGRDVRASSDMFELARLYNLQLAMTRSGSPFFWPAPIPEDGGAGASWHRSGLAAQKHAGKGWINVRADEGAGAYVVRTTTAEIPDPKWPNNNMRSLLELCFKARIIETPDHPVLRMLRGEA